MKAGHDFEYNTYVHKIQSIILSKTVEKSAKAYSCNTEMFDLAKRIFLCFVP